MLFCTFFCYVVLFFFYLFRFCHLILYSPVLYGHTQGFVLYCNALCQIIFLYSVLQGFYKSLSISIMDILYCFVMKYHFVCCSIVSRYIMSFLLFLSIYKRLFCAILSHRVLLYSFLCFVIKAFNNPLYMPTRGICRIIYCSFISYPVLSLYLLSCCVFVP